MVKSKAKQGTIKAKIYQDLVRREIQTCMKLITMIMIPDCES